MNTAIAHLRNVLGVATYESLARKGSQGALRIREVQDDHRHAIASAQTICPSKPSVFAMSR